LILSFILHNKKINFQGTGGEGRGGERRGEEGFTPPFLMKIDFQKTI
jgi:hypothetical protein